MYKRQLLEELTPLWTERGWTAPSDKSWCQDLCALLGPSLTLLKDGVDQAEPFFDRPELQDDALEQLAIEGAKAAIADMLQRLENNPWDGSDVDQAKAWLGDAAKAAGVKKGVVMKSLRAALLGRLQGPDLITTWSLLARIGEDLPRFRRCLG